MALFSKRRARKHDERREAEERRIQTEQTLRYLEFLNAGMNHQTALLEEVGKRLEEKLDATRNRRWS